MSNMRRIYLLISPPKTKQYLLISQYGRCYIMLGTADVTSLHATVHCCDGHCDNIIALVHVIVSFRCLSLALQSPFLSPSVSQASENGCSLY